MSRKSFLELLAYERTVSVICNNNSDVEKLKKQLNKAYFTVGFPNDLSKEWNK